MLHAVFALAQRVDPTPYRRHALAPEIRVNAVAPGLVATRWCGHLSEAELNQTRASFPLKRSVEPEEVATAAMELIRNDAMTGQTLAQDAGLLLL
jgi:3-oxoacyl-[acyl-carrier protein] reductase